MLRFLSLLFGAWALILAAAPASAQAPHWRVTDVSGDVTMIAGERQASARRGATMKAGWAVQTGSDGRAVLVRGREYVTVSPNSRLRLPGTDENGGIIQMVQDWGRALFQIEKKSTPHFGVRTPVLAAVVKGTTFRVIVNGNGAVVEVLEGAVEVGNLDGSSRQLVPAGRRGEVRGDNPRDVVVADGVTAEEAPSSPGVPDVPTPPSATTSSVSPTTPFVIASAIENDSVALGELTNYLVRGRTGGAEPQRGTREQLASAALVAPAAKTEPVSQPVDDRAALINTVIPTERSEDRTLAREAEDKASADADKAAADAQEAQERARLAQEAAQAEAERAVETARKAEEKAKDDAAKAVEEARRAEEKARAEAEKAAEDARQAEEKVRLLKEKARADADKAAEDARKAEDKARKDADKAAEDARRAEETARAEKAADDARKAEEKAKADSEKASDDARKAEEKARADSEKAAEDARRAEETARADKAAEDARKAEDKARKDADKAAEDARQAEEAARADKAADDARKAEDKARSEKKDRDDDKDDEDDDREDDDD